jgi:hemolysin D
MINILIVDDQRAVRERLRLALEKQADFVVLGAAANGEDALKMMALFHPDLVLLDLEMPGVSGIEVAVIARDRFPRTRIIILSHHDDAEAVRLSLQSGVKGYVSKQNVDAGMVEIIRSVHRGNSQFGPGLLEKVLFPSATLAVVQPPASAPLQTDQDEDVFSGELASTELITEDRYAIVPTSLPGEIQTVDRFQSTAITRITDWSNAAKEIIDGVPLPWTRGLFYLMLVFLGIAVPWAIFFQMDEIGTARGRLELTGDTVKREADISSNATITKVLVKKGDTVAKGQVIMELDSKDVRDQIQQNQVKLEGQQQRLNQLNLSKNQMEIALNTQKQQNQSQLSEKQTQIAQAEQTVRDRQSSRIQQQQEKANLVNQATRNIIDSTTTYNLAKNRLQDAQAEVNRYRKLLRQGGIAEVRTKEIESTAKERSQTAVQAQASLQQAKLRLKEQQDVYSKTVEQANADIKQAQLRLKEQQGSLQSLTQSAKLALVKIEQQLKEMQSQISTVENEILQSQQLIESLNDRLQKYTIRADVAGSIFELPTTREGSVMQPKQMIVEIAPSNGSQVDLILNGEIPANQSESLRTQGVGKEVKLKFDEFPFETYGIVPGKLVWISPNSKVTNTPMGASNTSYEVKIALNKSCLNYKEECLSFKSGQPATAEIIIRRRRIIDLITDPFTKLRG